jgi:hypothetical protein
MADYLQTWKLRLTPTGMHMYRHKMGQRLRLVRSASLKNQEAILTCCLLFGLHMFVNNLNNLGTFELDFFSALNEYSANPARSAHLLKEHKLTLGEKIDWADLDQLDLEGIPGIGPQTAKLIMDNYENLTQACASMETCRDGLIRLRGIGPVTANRLLESILLE